MTSSPHGPYAPGLHTCYNGPGQGDAKSTESRQSQKPVLSSDCGLQPARMKLESAGNRGSACRGECVHYRPCTHRPSSHQSGEHPKSHGAVTGRRRR